MRDVNPGLTEEIHHLAGAACNLADRSSAQRTTVRRLDRSARRNRAGHARDRASIVGGGISLGQRNSRRFYRLRVRFL